LLFSWVLQCNPQLAALITHTLGSDHWLVESKQLAILLPMAENAKFREAFHAIKQENKRRVRRLS
jgi:starch phosphorylase